MKRLFFVIPILFVTTVVLTILGLFFGTTYQRFFYGDATTDIEPIEITLKQKTPLYTNISGKEYVMLKAGTRLKITAYHCKDKDRLLLAETLDGRRGIIDSYFEPLDLKYGYDYKDGFYKMPAWQFYEECIGKTFEEFDGKYRRAVFVPKNPAKASSVTIPMPFAIRRSPDWKVYEPQVVYTNGVATNIEYKRIHGGNSLILKLLPATEWLIEKPFVQRIISSPQFVASQDLHKNKFLHYLSYPIRWLGSILYLCFLATLPVFALVLLMLLIPIFRVFNNTIMRLILIATSVTSSYLWWLIAMMEGYSWWYAWVSLIFNLGIGIAVSILIIKCRCEKCRHITIISRIDSKYLSSHTRIYEETIKRDFVTRHKEKGIKVTEEYLGDRLVDRTKKEVPIINESGGVHIDTYDLKYRVDSYRNKYQCAHCGHISEKEEEEETLLSRTQTGHKTVVNYTDHLTEDKSR